MTSKTVTRIEILSKIDKIISDNCVNCKTKAEIAKTDNRNFSNTNAYCTKECEIGQEIQSYGDMLLKVR